MLNFKSPEKRNEDFVNKIKPQVPLNPQQSKSNKLLPEDNENINEPASQMEYINEQPTQRRYKKSEAQIEKEAKKNVKSPFK
jgi:hypothetical protein